MSTTTAFVVGKLIVLRSNDGEIFEVEEAVVAESQTIKNMMEDVSVDDVITLPNVDGRTLSRVIEYCRKHVETGTDPEKSDELKAFDSVFDIENDYTPEEEDVVRKEHQWAFE